MTNLKTQLLDNGFLVYKKLIDIDILQKINNKVPLLVAHRGHDVDNKYWPQSKVKDCPELALWWSQQITYWPEIQKIEEFLLDLCKDLFDKPVLYIADVITNTPKNKYIKPHIDTPYRFDKWHNSRELLGVQCIIPLCKFTRENGGTGLLPGSHKKDWVVKESYAGTYNDEFLSKMVQPEMDLGDMLIYHPRVLHSTMPNKTEEPRRALLMHITDAFMVNQLKMVDTVFTGLPSF
jgi:hypothetical protein